MVDSLSSLRAAAIAFRDERDWAQFHRPKDLVLGLLAEAGELAEVVLWKTEAELSELSAAEGIRARLAEEMADVLVFLLYLSEAGDIDLAQAVRRKLEINAAKYPVERAKGSATKYTNL